MEKESKKINQLIKIFIKPKEAMEDITKDKKILVPMLCHLIFFFFSLFLIKGLLTNELSRNLIQTGNDMFENMPLEKLLYINLAFMYLMALAIPFIKSQVLHQILKRVESIDNLEKIINIVIYSYVIVSFGKVFTSVIAFVSKNIYVNFSLAMFLSPSNFGNKLYNALMLVDFFTIWYLAVTAIGLQVAFKISAKKSYIFSFAPFIVYVIYKLII